MDDRREILFVEQRAHTTRFLAANRFEWKGAAWLRKLFLHFGWLAEAWDEKTEVTRHVIHPDGVMEAIFRQRREMAQHISRDATKVYIGSDDYSELMASSEIRNFVTFPATAGYGRELLGLKVHIVPWMRGVLVAP